MRASRPGVLALALLALLASVTRGAWIVAYERHHPQATRPVIDEASYDAWARDLAAGDWLGDEVFFQEPLYPYVLGAAYAAFGADTAVARRLNVAFSIVYVLGAALLAARIGGRRAGLAVGVVAAVAPPLVHMSALVLKPSLFLALLACLALALTSSGDGGRAGASRAPRGQVWVGVLGALAALVRGNALLLLPLVLAWPLARRLLDRSARADSRTRDARRCAWATLGAALVLLPVALRNQVVGGVFALTTSGAGTNVYVGNHPDNPWGVATELDFVRGIPEHEAEDWRREAERRLGRALDRGEVSAYWLGETARSLAARPLTHLALCARKLRLALHRGEVADNHSLAWDAREVRRAGAGPVVLDLPLGGWFPWGALGLAGASLACMPRRFAARTLGDVDLRVARELACLAFAYLATLVLTVVVGRMRLPLFWLVLPLAPLAPLALARALRSGARRDALPAGLALAVAFGLALAPARPAALEEADLDERDFNVAVQHLEHGEPAAALARAAPLFARHSTQRVRLLVAEAHLGRARELLAFGLGVESARSANEALTLLAAARELRAGTRERFQLDALRGRVALLRGEPGEALAALRAARAFDPDDAGLALDELRARAMAQAPPFEGLRAEAAAFAQAPTLAPELRTPARLFWAELEANCIGEGEQHLVDALKILKGTLDTLSADDPARAAVHLLAARIQYDQGNTAAARGQLETLLKTWPDHGTALELLRRLE